MAESIAGDALKAWARDIAEKELRYRKFSSEWTGIPDEMYKAWLEVEHASFSLNIARTRSMTLRQRLMAHDRAHALLARLERLHSLPQPSPISQP